jgi:hypothetical protein
MLSLISVLGLVIILSTASQTDSAKSVPAPTEACPVLVHRVTFLGKITVSQSEQQKFAKELEGKTCSSDSDLTQRIMNFWREFGFWRAQAKLESDVSMVDGQRVANLSFRIDEGAQYRLKELRPNGTSAVTPAELERMFSMKPGDPVDLTRERRGVGLLRAAFVDRGYSQVVIVPQMVFNETDHTMLLILDVRTGVKDSMRLDAALCKSVLDDFPTGPLAASFVPVLTYDPRRNALQDVQNAIREANQTRRNVLLEVGGEWCVWCHTLDRMFQEHAELSQLRDANFVTVLVNESHENNNEALLKRLPKMSGAPHLFVLDQYGKLLVSETSSDLEEGRGYSARRIGDFLLRWSPHDSPVKCPERPSGTKP